MFKKRLITFFMVATFILGCTSVSANEIDVEKQKLEQFRAETGRVDSKDGLLADDRMQARVGSYTLYGYGEDFHNGKALYSAFDASLTDNGFGSYMDGQSRALWSGATPYNCDELMLETAIKLTGVGISVTAGSSGFDISGGLTSKTLSMSDTIEDNYQKIQNYTDVTFDGVDLFYRHTATARFTFGVNTYYTNATDSVWP
jgi:hypothetical protein